MKKYYICVAYFLVLHRAVSLTCNPLYHRSAKIYLKECPKVTYSVHLLHTISAAQISTAVTMLLTTFLLSCAMHHQVMAKVSRDLHFRTINYKQNNV